MKRLIIITRKEKLGEIKNIFRDKYSNGMTVTDVVGIGNQSDFMDVESDPIEEYSGHRLHEMARMG